MANPVLRNMLNAGEMVVAPGFTRELLKIGD